MLNADEERAQRELLARYRSNLRLLLRQAGSYGGEDNLPIKLFNDIAAQRTEIARIKAILRAAKLHVDDLPDDTSADAPTPEGASPAQAQPPAQGNVYISGGTIYGTVIGTNTGDVSGGNYTFGKEKEEE